MLNIWMTLIQQKSRISFSEPKHQLAILVILLTLWFLLKKLQIYHLPDNLPLMREHLSAHCSIHLREKKATKRCLENLLCCGCCQGKREHIYIKQFQAKLMWHRKDTRSRALEEKMELMLDKCLCLLFEAFEGHKKKPTGAHPSLLYLATWLIRQVIMWREGKCQRTIRPFCECSWTCSF